MSPLLDLNNDALRAVLARTCAKDHLNLCLTCSRVNGIINSPEFRQERCESGAAEISVRVLTPFELYKEHMGYGGEPKESDEWFQDNYDSFGSRDSHYGYRNNEARICIDGRLAGKSSFTLLPRELHQNFHTMCDMISADIQETGCAFFDVRGRPRLESVKKAMSNGDTTAFLYINSFDLHKPEYRTTSTTGAIALRKLLTDTTLKDMWSVAVYIPDPKSQFSQQDREMNLTMRFRQRERFFRSDSGEEDLSDTESEINWSNRRDDLTKTDMHHFLQAGFQQAKELVFDHNCFFVFVVPSFLEPPMISDEEARSIKVFERPKLRKKTKDEKQLLNKMKLFCSERRQLEDELREWQRPLDEQVLYQRCKECSAELSTQVDRMVEQLNESLRDAQQYRQQFDEMAATTTEAELACRRMLASLPDSQTIDSSAVEAHLQQFEVSKRLIREGIENANSLVAERENEIASATRRQGEMERSVESLYCEEVEEKKRIKRQEIQELDERVRDEVSKLVENNGTDIIQNSDALHACACNLQPDYIEMLLSFVPNEKKRSVVNGLDVHGETPLRTATLSGAFKSKYCEMFLQTCQKIIDLGGDKNLTNANGLSALGTFRKANSSICGFWGALTHANPNDRAQEGLSSLAMEELLWPVLGPTAADDALLGGGSESDVGEDDDFNEEDEDDNGIEEDEEVGENGHD